MVIHGGCRGADNVSGGVARSRGFPVRVYPADWDRYGRGAGPVRNQLMLEKEHEADEPIDLVLAFHISPDLGKGTRDMVRRAVEAGIPVQCFTKRSEIPRTVWERLLDGDSFDGAAQAP